MSAEAWLCQSLACCVTLGKFLDLSEPEDPGVGEGRPRAWLLWATGTVSYCSFLWSPRHSGARSAAAPLRGWAHNALCGHRHPEPRACLFTCSGAGGHLSCAAAEDALAGDRGLLSSGPCGGLPSGSVRAPKL